MPHKEVVRLVDSHDDVLRFDISGSFAGVQIRLLGLRWGIGVGKKGFGMRREWGCAMNEYVWFFFSCNE